MHCDTSSETAQCAAKPVFGWHACAGNGPTGLATIVSLAPYFTLRSADHRRPATARLLTGLPFWLFMRGRNLRYADRCWVAINIHHHVIDSPRGTLCSGRAVVLVC